MEGRNDQNGCQSPDCGEIIHSRDSLTSEPEDREEGIQAGKPGMDCYNLSEMRRCPSIAATWHSMPEIKQVGKSIYMEG